MDALAQAESRLFARVARGIKPGLEITRAVLDELQHPEQAVPCIHVAGTNGKGSVCAFMESALRAQGLATGLFTSPHLVRFNERFQCSGKAISDADLASLMDVAVDASARAVAAGAEREATFFELSAAMAFEHFKNQAVRMSVIETGLGGRWDATNVVMPLVSVLTDIGFDHQEFLGNTLTGIAAEKAGIIKTGRPVVCGSLPEEVRPVVARAAAACGVSPQYSSDLVSARVLERSVEGWKVAFETASGGGFRVRLPLLGDHQVANASLALAALEVLSETLSVEPDYGNWKAGFERTRWPARIQVLQHEPPLILDGGHNPGGWRVLGQTLKQLWPKRPLGLLTGFLQEKDPAACLRALGQPVHACWTVDMATDRGRSATETAQHLSLAGLSAQPTALEPGLHALLDWARCENGIALIAGSLYLAGSVLRLLEYEET